VLHVALDEGTFGETRGEVPPQCRGDKAVCAHSPAASQTATWEL